MTETLAAYLETFGDPADTHRLAFEAAREASVLLTARGPGEESVRQRTRRPGPLDGRRHPRGSTGMDRGSALQTLAETARNTSGPARTGLSRGCTRTRDAETVPALKPRVGHERPFGTLASLPSSRRQSRGGWTMV